MSRQLDSPHFFRTGDIVRDDDGRTGRVVYGTTLYAMIEWEGAPLVEVDQFDPHVVVVERAPQT